jgi:hypothetical protein
MTTVSIDPVELSRRSPVPAERIDFRARRSSSPEGSGRAHRAVEDLHAERRRFHEPDIDVAITIASSGLDHELIGFWAMWHLVGGFDALVRFGMHPATVWRKVRRFRTVTGQHPDDCEFDGIEIDATGFLDAIERSLGWCHARACVGSDDAPPHLRRCE